MSGKELWKLGMLNVFSAPVRSFLTVLGMAIGIAAILAVLTLGNAGQMQVRSEMNRLGIDKVWITSDGINTLKAGDGQRISNALSIVATEQIYLTAQVTAGDTTSENVIVGCLGEYLNQTGVTVIEGRMLYPLEWMGEGHSALLGRNAAARLRVHPGDLLLVQNQLFTVRGIIDTNGGFSRAEIAEALFVPIGTLLAYTDDTVQEIMLAIPEGGEPQSTADMARHMMNLQRKTDVDALTMQLQIDAANSVIDTFVDVLSWVAVICMLVGGIGVMNILLVGVRERRREIGIMQSLGMKSIQITILFLLEALMYAAIGGGLGLLFGAGLIDSAGKSIGLSPAINAGDCIAVLLAAIAVGVTSGVVPALRASGLKPVDALRSE